MRLGDEQLDIEETEEIENKHHLEIEEVKVPKVFASTEEELWKNKFTENKFQNNTAEIGNLEKENKQTHKIEDFDYEKVFALTEEELLMLNVYLSLCASE